MAESLPKTCTPSTSDPDTAADRYRELTQRQEDRLRERRTSDILAVSNLPARHLGRRADDESYPQWAQARDRAMQATAEGYSVLLCGPRGTGKTQIAADVGFDFANRQKSVLYTKASQMFRELRQAMHEYREVQAMDAICRKGILIIDEAHVRGETDYEDRTIVEIFDRRYDNLLPTILITNLTLAEAKAALGASIVDRCVECGRAIVCDWKSLRPSVREVDHA